MEVLEALSEEVILVVTLAVIIVVIAPATELAILVHEQLLEVTSEYPDCLHVSRILR